LGVIAAERTVEQALGYYINPTFSVFLLGRCCWVKSQQLQWAAGLITAAAVAF
jgi:chloramphenicol-sensitive protein RarD